jgi:predicted transcriptional regulator
VRKSLASHDHILSLIDGKPYQSLKRHLSKHGLTPEQYRARYRLKADYPITAPAYSERRRALAQRIGLGAKGGKARAEGASAPNATPKRARARAKGVQQPPE